MNSISGDHVRIYDLRLTKNLFIYFLVANWGLPLAAIADLKKDPEIISPKMTVGKIEIDDYSK
jgi:hypothetical protein